MLITIITIIQIVIIPSQAGSRPAVLCRDGLASGGEADESLSRRCQRGVRDVTYRSRWPRYGALACHNSQRLADHIPFPSYRLASGRQADGGLKRVALDHLSGAGRRFKSEIVTHISCSFYRLEAALYLLSQKIGRLLPMVVRKLAIGVVFTSCLNGQRAKTL